jgi:hypothetical protein
MNGILSCPENSSDFRSNYFDPEITVDLAATRDYPAGQ